MKTLFEGGNIFKNAEGPLTDRIATKDVESTVAFIEKITGLDFTAEKGEDKKPVKWLGTTGRKENADGTFELNSSGDLDLSVDANETSKEELIEKLVAWCSEQGIDQAEMMNKGRKITDKWIKDAGDQVHFRTPINGNPSNGYVQTDFMFSATPDFQRGSMIGGSEKYRGEHRHILLSSIARARGLKYSPKFGLVDPDTNEVISNDWNVIAKHLLGQTATVADIRSVEKITDYIKKLPNYEELIAAAAETLGKYGVELPAKESLENYVEGSTDWFRAVIGILTERKSADLYHGTHNAADILQSGSIKPQKNDEEYEVDPDGITGTPYISLTRDSRFAKNSGFPVNLVIDQAKLTNTHRIRPIDALYSYDPDSYGRRQESEERIYRDIPISYIKQIIILDKKWTEDLDIIEKIAAKHNIPIVYNESIIGRYR